MRKTPQILAADKKIGERLKFVRLAFGLTQSELAKKARVTFQQIQKYENGVNRISVSRLLLLCKALKYRPDDFLRPIKF